MNADLASNGQNDFMTRECFVLSPIGANGSEIRRHADQFFRHIVQPACKENGYHASRADRLDEAGVITHQILARIARAPLLIADLTSQNPNVFYELAIRHALQQPIIHMARVGEKLPFDIAGFRTIFFDLTDPDSVIEAKNTLDRYIKSLDTIPFAGPIQIAVSVSQLESSANPQDVTLTEIMQSVSDLRNDFRSFRDEVSPTYPDAPKMFNAAYLEHLRTAYPLSKLIGKFVQLKRVGKEYVGLSPFLPETTPAFYVNDNKKTWFDFSSGKNGNVFDFFVETEKLSFDQSVLRVAALTQEEDALPF